MSATKRPLRDGFMVGVVLTLAVPWVIGVVVPALVIGRPASWAYGRWLRMQWERTWGRQGTRVLLVYSRSPNWQGYIETTWLPQIEPYAVFVDWSDRSTWPRRAPVEIRAFRHWGGAREYNPLAFLFPTRGGIRTIRLWQAFRDSRHGKEDELRRAEAKLFEFVDGLRSGAV